MLLCLLPAGCWSRKEITNLSIVIAQAIDQAAENDKLICSVQIVNPAAMQKTAEGGGGGAEKPFFIATSSGFTIADAERNLYKHVARPLFWQHIRVLIISEELARTKMEAILDSLDRVAAYRRKMLLVVTPGKAREALEAEPPIGKLSGQMIFDLARITYKHSEAYYPSDINNFLIALSGNGIEPVLARLEIKKINEPESSAAQQGMGPAKRKILQLSGSAVFKAEKMVGWLNDVETRGLLWVRGKALNNMLVLKYPGSKDKEELITILNQRVSSKIRPEMVGGKLRVIVEIGAKGRISEQSFTAKDPAKTDIFKLLDRQYAAAIEREVRLALARAQNDFTADIFGFGLAISRQYPKLWKQMKPDWDEEFRRLEVIVKVKASIRRMGLTLKPTQPE